MTWWVALLFVVAGAFAATFIGLLVCWCWGEPDDRDSW